MSVKLYDLQKRVTALEVRQSFIAEEIMDIKFRIEKEMLKGVKE